MGLVTGLLLLPLAPVRGVTWVAEQLQSQAERIAYDERSIRSQLLELELAFDAGEIDEVQRDREQAQLLERLSIGLALRSARAQGAPGG